MDKITITFYVWKCNKTQFSATSPISDKIYGIGDTKEAAINSYIEKFNNEPGLIEPMSEFITTKKYEFKIVE